MSRSACIVAFVALGTLLAGCGGGNVVLRPQSDALLVSPTSTVLSAAASGSTAVSFLDKASSANVSLSNGTCTGIAAWNQGIAGSSRARVMTVGSNPGINVGGGSGNSAGASGSYGVSAIAPGTCTLRLSDSLGNVATVFVTVTK